MCHRKSVITSDTNQPAQLQRSVELRHEKINVLHMGLFQKIGKNNGCHFFFLNLQNGLTELINHVMFIQFLLHIYIRDKIFSFLSVVQKYSYFLSKMS